MADIKAWVLRLFGLSALAAVFVPWHHVPVLPASIPASPAVVEQTANKIQDRLPQDVWPKIEGPAHVVLPTDIGSSKPTEEPEATPVSPAAKPVTMPVKVKHRPQRHVIASPQAERVEDDLVSSFFKAAARLAGAIP